MAASIMERLTEIWEKKSARRDWLIGIDSDQFSQQSQQLFQELSQQQPRPKILLAESEPVKFLASFTAAVNANCPIFLGNPHWVELEWQQVLKLVQPDIILAPSTTPPTPHPLLTPATTIHNPTDTPSAANIRCQHLLPTSAATAPIMIPTGGSSGKIRFAIHTLETLTASVKGFQQYFGKTAINSCCVLPLYHVSGLMQFLRSFTTGGKLAIFPFKSIPEDCPINPSEFFISLVPTQLQQLLQTRPTWLSHFDTVLLGGAPAWEELLETARKHRLRLAPTYGMTETASQVVTLKPEDFLQGNNSCGRVLPHAKVSIQSPTGEILNVNKTGAIAIKANSLMLGYYAETGNQEGRYYQSDDLGYFDDRHFLHVVGRRSNKIITGGENVFPAEVEAAIRATGLVKDVCVLGIPDPEWGQVVTAVCAPVDAGVSSTTIAEAIANKLSKYKRPKHWVAVENLPRNAQGKLLSSQVMQLVNKKQH